MSKLKVFYDGQCHLCHREIKFYMKLDKNKLLDPIDIMAKDFSAQVFGLNEQDVHVHIHAIDESGQIFTKVDTFIQIWKRVPYHGFLVKIASFAPIKFLMDKGYIIFAEHIRPRLPKRKCDSDSCGL